jgi:hypothetical protein
MPDADFLLKVVRRLVLWTVICSISAAPSFAWASRQFNRSGMVFGVALFIALYTTLSCTPTFEDFHSRPHVRTTLYVGYWVRVGLSILFPLGMGLDLVPGLISLNIVNATGLRPESFAGTLATTIVQGTILNILLFFFMLIVYSILRFRSPIPPQPRGFEIIIPEAQVARTVQEIHAPAIPEESSRSS